MVGVAERLRSRKCPTCGSRMEKVKDDLDRVFYRCAQCGAQVPEDFVISEQEDDGYPN